MNNEKADGVRHQWLLMQPNGGVSGREVGPGWQIGDEGINGRFRAGDRRHGLLARWLRQGCGGAAVTGMLAKIASHTAVGGDRILLGGKRFNAGRSAGISAGFPAGCRHAAAVNRRQRRLQRKDQQ
ncbi:MAG TPA: hypothetical protein VGC21_00900 [Telluria sp.]